MSAQLNIFLLLFGGLQGLLFSLFLFRKKLAQSSYIFLLLYMGVMLLQLTLKVMNKLWLMENWAVVYSLSSYLPLLYGPLVYLFVKHMVEFRTFTPKVLLHFLPFFLISMATIITEWEIAPAAIEFIVYNPELRGLILSVSLIFYHILAFRLWKHHRFQDFSETYTLQKNWLRSFVLLSFIVCAVVVAATYLLFIKYPRGHEFRYGFAGLTFFIYWISYTALKQPVLFSVTKGYVKSNNEHFPKLVVHRLVTKYASSTLDDKEKKRICESLDDILIREKIYLDAELTIDSLAEKVSCTRHSLSQVLNECKQQSYYDYINHFRVKEAEALLLDESRKDYKIASIAYDAGFNSLSTFNEVFKKTSGCTPSQFRRYGEGVLTRQRV